MLLMHTCADTCICSKMSDAEKEDKTLLEENDSDTDADESNASESHSATPSQDVSDDKHLRKLQAKDVEEYDDAEKLMAINVQNIDTSTLCDNCTTRYKEFKSNVFQNKGWMIWETLMVTFDFALDISVVISYFQLKETFPAVVLMLIIINYMLVHFWESNRAGQPFWVAISGTGSMYESYKSWGLEKPTVSWDKVRYRHAVAEALPQTLFQAIFIDAAAIADSKHTTVTSGEILQLFSIFFSVANLCYTITEKACSTQTEDRVYFVESLMAAPCSEEAISRVCILIFFLADTTFRVLVLSVFLNLSPITPWNYIVLIFIYLLLTLFNFEKNKEYTPRKIVELFGQGLLDLLVCHDLMKLQSSNSAHVSSNAQSILVQFVINVTMFGTYLYCEWNQILFDLALSVFIIAFLFLFPSVWYMLNKQDVFDRYKHTTRLSSVYTLDHCDCGQNLAFANLVDHE